MAFDSAEERREPSGRGGGAFACQKQGESVSRGKKLDHVEHCGSLEDARLESSLLPET